ncbi:MAG: hypothetical protein ACPHJ3_19605, partial [Rubripirellula sp.]
MHSSDSQSPSSDSPGAADVGAYALPVSALSGCLGSGSDHVQRVPRRGWLGAAEVILLVGLFFVYAGDSAPMVNEAHYLVKAKNYWDPAWCSQDMFVSS